MILYKPLEASLEKLELLAKARNRAEFREEQVRFYSLLNEMEQKMRIRVMDYREIGESQRHYQTRLEQLRLLMGNPNPMDFGQTFEGTD